MKMTKTKLVPPHKEPRYQVPTVAQAIGLSEGAVSGYFNNRKISAREGLTLAQIVDVIEARRRGPGIDWTACNEIRKRLSEEYGYEMTEDE